MFFDKIEQKFRCIISRARSVLCLVQRIRTSNFVMLNVAGNLFKSFSCIVSNSFIISTFMLHQLPVQETIERCVSKDRNLWMGSFHASRMPDVTSGKV